MLKKILMILAISAVVASTHALAQENGNREPDREAKQVLRLKDGSTVYIFSGDNMAREPNAGSATQTEYGIVMVAKSGGKIIMVGDEVARLFELLREDYAN